MTSEAPQDVAALLRELAEKATPGPWTADCVPGWGDGPGPNLPDAVSGFEERVALNLITGDARYIAAASPDVVRGLLDQNDRLRSALEGMVEQFAYWSDIAGGYWTGGLSALEEAFDVLGWPDPKPEPAARCDEPGCMNHATTGWPSPAGYRRTCSKHHVFLRGSGAEEAAPND